MIAVVRQIILKCISIIIFYTTAVVKIPGVKNTKLKTKSGVAASPCRLDIISVIIICY